MRKIGLLEARQIGQSRYFTGKPCKYGHIDWRITGSCLCLPCSRMHKRKDHQKNKHNKEYISKRNKYSNEHKKEKKLYDIKYRKENRELINRRSRERSKNNKEKRSAISQNYKHRRRTQEEGGVSSIDLMMWKKQQDKICYWCSKECEKKFHLDHYIPLSKGGAHDIENIVISCPSCNVRKNNKMPDVWIREMIA